MISISRLLLRILSFLLLTSLLSCNQKKFLESSTRLKQKELLQLQQQGLQYYPEITPCEGMDSKKCFESQLNNYLSKQLGAYPKILKGISDTIWLPIEVDYSGNIRLLESSLNQEYTPITQKVSHALKALPPLKPAFINGTYVTAHFKLPLLLKP